MAGKKKETKLTEEEKAMLEDDEVEALEAPDEEGKELEKEEGKEGEQGGEGKEKKEGKEGEPPEKKPEAEPPEGKGEEEKAKEGEADVEIPDQTATMLKDLNIPIQTKNGKHFIPYSELEKARKKASEYKAEAEQVKTEMATLRSRVEHLETPKAEEKPPAEKPPEVDLDEIERQIYDGEITPKEGMELVKKAQATVEAKAEAEETKPVDPNEIAARVEWKLKFDAGLAKIYEEHPALKENEELNKKAKRFGEAIINEALDGKTDEEAMAWLADPENVITAAKQAAKEVTDSSPPKESDNFDAEAEREKIRKEETEKITAALVTKFNLKPDEVKTLSDVPGSSGPANKGEELDQKSAEELEDAMEGMSAEERTRYVDGKFD